MGLELNVLYIQTKLDTWGAVAGSKWRDMLTGKKVFI